MTYPHRLLRSIRNALLLSCALPVSSLLTNPAGLHASESMPQAEPSEEGVKFFESKIRPILFNRCAGCHGEDEQESGLRLDHLSGMLSGGTSGPALVPGKPDESILIGAVTYKDEHLKMPPDERLPDEEIKLLREWVERGAPHPEQGKGGGIQPRRGSIDLAEARKYWAFQPVSRPEVPDVKSDWVKSPIDALQFAYLQKQGLQPNQPADKLTLIRRATFDLTGLPPTPEDVNEYLRDESPEAFEKVVDRLLASKAYGERWGRHWLDVVRYADSNGLDENMGFVDAWRYRNYVINSFNSDLPYDQFIMQQVAGDLLPRPEPTGDIALDYAPAIATGMLLLGPKALAEVDKVKMQMDIIDEQIDVLGQSILGLTIACARCHDHKFDPISTADYYALAGILKSTSSMQSLATVAKYQEHILAPDDEIETQKKLAEQQKAKKAEIDAAVKAANEALLKEMNAAAGTKPPADAEQKYPEETRAALAKLRAEQEEITKQIRTLPTAMAVKEDKPTNTKIHVRGSHLTLGREVQRGIPEVLEQTGQLEIPEGSSGRLELAKWLVSKNNPLTARVAVNRIWRWHFGEGIVSTPDNFGRLGVAPSNPELLDWLAAEFMESGWSFKAMHRKILLSSTWQMSSEQNIQNATLDPANMHHWRSNVTRLDAESIRDSLLFVSGTLNPEPSESVIATSKWTLVFDHTSKDGTTYDLTRRSVYLPVIRNNVYDALSLFDYTTPDVTTGNRETSTVAPQALFMLNSDVVLNAADAFAARLFKEIDGADENEGRVVRMYELAYGRAPQSYEAQRMLSFITDMEQVLASDPETKDARMSAWSAACQSVLGSNEFVYIE